MLKPINDLAKIRISDTKPKIIRETKDTSESGVLVELPDKFNYFGFWSFAFENSFMNREALDDIYKYWEQQIGKRVFWTALSEKGNILEDGEERFAFVKLTSLIAIDEADSNARNIHSDGAGQFKA